MTVRFDDSLPILARAVAEMLGDDALHSGVVLRDFTGKLSFFSATALNKNRAKQLAKRLSEALGPYAREDRVVAGIDEFGAEEVLHDRSILNIRVDDHDVRLVDRRLVGVDWLRTPAPLAPPPPRFVFSSIKGGVGRSTALSVGAVDLASRGRRVLAIDLDMEAPGIGAMLLDEGTLPEFGMIDALVENATSKLDEQFLSDLVGPSAIAAHTGRIDVLPAFGKRSLRNPSEILAKIARAYAEDVKSDGSVLTILDQVRDVVDYFANTKRYDAILVDSRAGLHETTASAILGLGAEVFLFGLDEPQTFQGYSALLAHLARFVKPNTAPEWLERLTMVQGKAPADIEAQRSYSEKCRMLFSQAGLVSNSEYLSSLVKLPAEPFSNVPWDDDDNVDDDELDLQESTGPRETVSILDDERFRLFEPDRSQRILSERVYRSSFGPFLDRLHEAFLDNKD
jgi:hypothetical protein